MATFLPTKVLNLLTGTNKTDMISWCRKDAGEDRIRSTSLLSADDFVNYYFVFPWTAEAIKTRGESFGLRLVDANQKEIQVIFNQTHVFINNESEETKFSSNDLLSIHNKIGSVLDI